MTAVPHKPPPAGRLGLLWELLFGVKLARPIVCPCCRWRHHRARLQALETLAKGGAVRCAWCRCHIARRKGPQR